MQIGIGEVEEPQDPRHELAVDAAINGAPFRKGRLERLDRLPSEGKIELTRGGHHRIAEFLVTEPVRVHAPEEPVSRIDRQGIRPRRGPGGPQGRLPPGLRGEDEAVQFLQAPTFPDEPDREPVEQLGMRGRIGAGAEIARSRDESGSEMLRPDPVDDDAGGEGICRIGDRLGELETPAPDREGRAILA